MKKGLFILVFAFISIINMNAYGVTKININPKFENKMIEFVNHDSINTNKIKSINKYLDIKDNQKIFFNEISNNMYVAIHKFMNERENGIQEFKMHLNNNIKNSRMILDDYQMKKYLRVINVTLANNNLSKYIID